MSRARFLMLLALGCTAQNPQARFDHAPGSPLAIEGGAGNVVLGDLNQDTHPDLVVAGGQANALRILWGDGEGRFKPTPQASIPLDAPPGEMLLADLDADRVLDLAIASHDSYAVSVFLGDGRGGFRPVAGSPFAAMSGSTPHNHGLQAGDANEDGRVDLITVQSESDCVALLLGDGRGGFAPAPTVPVPVGPAPYPPALGDLDGDGHLDIVVPETGTGRYWREHKRLAQTITLLLGDGKGGFEPAPGSPLRVADGPYYVALGDLDGDRDLDLVASHDDCDLVSVLLNDGKAGFQPLPNSPLAIGSRAVNVVVADANSDGRGDLVLATGDSVTLLLGDGHGDFTPAPGSPFAVGPGTWRVVAGDLNHDGKLDLASSNLEARSVSVLLGR